MQILIILLGENPNQSSLVESTQARFGLEVF